jgi:hypothetical protein
MIKIFKPKTNHILNGSKSKIDDDDSKQTKITIVIKNEKI